jgi:hypothetical protein
MHIEFTDGPKSPDQIFQSWKKNTPIEVLVQLTSKQIKKLNSKKRFQPGRIYSLRLKFRDFETMGFDKLVLKTNLATASVGGDLVGFSYEIICNLTDGTGHIKARKLF